MSILSFKSTRLGGLNKTGVMRPDADGYYTVSLGALGSHNSMGHYYTLDESAALFKASSSLMNRIDEGALYSEVGHPQKQPGMAEKQYFMRLMTIVESNICGHISEIWLDDSIWKTRPEHLDRGSVVVMGKIKPYGIHKQMLSDALENPKLNVCFSLRGFTKDVNVNGKIIRTITFIMTYDLVYLPGLKAGSSWNANPTMESMVEFEILDEDARSAIEEATTAGVANESSISLAREAIITNDKPNILLPKKQAIYLQTW